MYRFVSVADQLVEVCDECGFNGAVTPIAEVPARLGAVGDAWSRLLVGDESALRARPAPATWCAVEYGQHTAFALSAIEWAARQFAEGISPDWSLYGEDPLGDATDRNHGCGPFAIDDTLASIQQASASLAGFTKKLTDSEVAVTADYGGGLILTTGAVVRHALHDAEHHVLDVRRGLARLLLAR